MDTEATTRPTAYPVGIIVVVIVTAIRGFLIAVVLGVDAGVIPLDWLVRYSPIPIYPGGTAIGVLSRGMLVALLVVCVLSIWGLLRRHEWGWTISIVAAGLVLALNLGWWAAGDARDVSMLLNAIVVLYLNQRDVRAIFHVGHA